MIVMYLERYFKAFFNLSTYRDRLSIIKLQATLQANVQEY